MEARKKSVNCNKLQRKCDRGRENACRKIRKHCPPTVTVEPNVPSETSLTPGTPSGLVVHAYPTRIEIQWSPPNSDAAVEGYKLGYGKNMPDIYLITLGPDTFSYVINDFEPNSLYVIRLRAFNGVMYGHSIYEILETKGEQGQEPNETTTLAHPPRDHTLLGGRQDPSHQEVHNAGVEEDHDALLMDADEFLRPEATDHPI